MSKKIKFLARFLVLTVIVTFVGCNEELYDVKDQHNGVDKNKISLAQFKNETNIGKVEPFLIVSTTKSISSKTKPQLSDFVIDTLAIKKHISENNKTTYSFRIYPLSAVAKPNEIYNLVYRLVNGNWEKSIFYLIKKDKVTEDHKLFEKIELIYGSTVNKITTSKTSSFECTIEIMTVQCDGNSFCTDRRACDGFACETGQCIKSTISYAACSSGSSTGGGSPDPGGTFSSGGGTPDPYVYSPNTYDNPVFDDAYLIYLARREQIWTNLGDVARGFFAKDENIGFFNKSVQYQWDKNWLPESYEFANLARIYKYENPVVTWEDIYFNRTLLDTNSAVDIDNNADGGIDTNIYSDFNPQQTWATISQVIPTNQFVGWGSPGITRNCMDYAKAQIAKKGYQISNYGSAGQTFQIYTEQNGVNRANLSQGLSYLKYALNNNIPVIVGVDDNPGHPGNPDNSTDHFIVIVGMGSNSNGNYFRFYDNASGNTSEGTSSLNLLYYNSSTGKITGKSQCSGYFNSVAHDYIITQIRKSKTKQ